MLQDIREKSQGWISWTIVTVICITFALWGIHSYLYSSAATNTVAKVNGIKITQAELSNSLNQLRRQQAMRLGLNYSYSQQQSDMLKKMALQSLISNIVMNQSAIKNGFRVGSDLVEIAIAKMPIFQVKGIFSSARFEQVLSGMLYSEQQFFEQLQQTLILNQLRMGIISSVFALPFEVAQTIQLVHQTRDFGYTLISAKTFLSEEHILRKDAIRYYQQHQDEFKTPEAVSIEYLQLSVPHLMQKIHPTAQQLHQFYQDNIASYTIPKQWQLAHILVSISFKATQKQIDIAQAKINSIAHKIKSGHDFTQLAKQYSSDDVTANQGEVFPWMSSGQMDKAVRPVLVQLTHVGDVSTPLRTQQGFEIVKLLKTKTKKVYSFDQVRDKVFDAYRQQKAEQQFSNLSDELANLTYEDPNTLNSAAKKLGLSIQSTDLFTKEGAKQGFTSNAKIIRAAFNDDVLAQSNNSDLINLNDNSVVVLRVKQHQPSKVKPFNIVKPQIITKLKREAATKKAQTLGQTLLAKIQKNKLPKLVIASKHLNWIEQYSITRNNKTLASSVLNLAFNMPPSSQKNGKTVQGQSLKNGDFIIVALTRVKNGNVKSFSVKQKQLFNKGKENNLGILEYQLYTHQLLKDAKIKFYKE